MPRRSRKESTSVGHGSNPLIVKEIDPVDEHPSLGPLRRAKQKLAVLKSRRKSAVKVKVDVVSE